ncbi:MAG TPA: hypothetical protein VJR23_00930 [Candidatus Acidoferrales bacterium]|nr:hypothetical protein [Candidatus Acidoferrales bacterium]
MEFKSDESRARKTCRKSRKWGGPCFAMLFVTVVLSSCNRVENDWKQAKDANSSAAYAEFLTSHPKGPHADEAQAAMESLDWDAAKGASSISGYEEYLKKHPTGRFSEGAKTTLQDLQWAEAKRKASVESYKGFLEAHPASPYKGEAIARIAALGLTKADSMSITDGGAGDDLFGAFSARLSPEGGIGSLELSGAKKVFIFRNLPMGAEEAEKLGIKAGAAYLWQENQFLYIRDVDGKLSDKALCAQFGVSTSNSWHRTYWSAPANVKQK